MDLSDCNYLDSTFLGCLVILHKRGCGHGNRFHVHANGPVREKLLHPTRLDQLLSFCARPPETMGAHVTLQVTDLERDEFGRHLLATHDELAKLGGPAAGAFERVAAQLRRELGES